MLSGMVVRTAATAVVKLGVTLLISGPRLT
jgi:hypothetical protein